MSAKDELLEDARRDMVRSLDANMRALPNLRVSVAEWERPDMIVVDSLTQEEQRLEQITMFRENREATSRRRTVAVRSDGGAHLIDPRKLFKPGAP